MKSKLLKQSCLAVAVAGLLACNYNDAKHTDTASIGVNNIAAKKSGTLESATKLEADSFANNSQNSWYIDAEAKIAQAKINSSKINNTRGAAKNIILFVGDGMGISTITAARILAGQRKGMMGEENQLSFEQFPFSGLSKTYNVDTQTPDSAGTMTAIISGVKTDAGLIGVSEHGSRADCATTAGNELVTALELAEIAGLATGIVSTARVTHATPAATYAKSVERNWEDDSDMPAAAKLAGCKDIAAQLIDFEANLEAKYAGVDVDGMEVVMGGGRRGFLPKVAAATSSAVVNNGGGDRVDNRNLIAEWQSIYPAGAYVSDQAGFDAIDAASTSRVFALFNPSHMRYEADRTNAVAGEPSLSEMTAKAIDVLGNNPKGFFLMVESGRIDHAHHAGNAYNALTDTIELAKAVQVAVDNTDAEETLIIVTADHSHVFTMAGYPKRGNPILGKVVSVGATTPQLAADGMPYTTVGYANGYGFRDYGMVSNADSVYDGAAPLSGRIDITSVDTQAPGYHQEALVPLQTETHGGEDVAIFAQGPASHLVTGTNEQSIIFHVMNFAGDLAQKANAVLNASREN